MKYSEQIGVGFEILKYVFIYVFFFIKLYFLSFFKEYYELNKLFKYL